MPFQSLPDHVDYQALRSYSPSANTLVLEGEVVIRYGSSKLTADRLTAYRGTVMRMVDGKSTPVLEIIRGTAEGRVTLVDPAGTVNADRFEFGFEPAHPYQRAQNVSIRIGNARLHARRAEFDKSEWQLYDVEGTTSLSGKPLYLVSSDHISVSPDKQATIHQPRVSLLGKSFATLPTQRASLVQAVPGIHYPTIGYKVDRGFGVSFSGGLVAGPDSVFSYNSRIYPNRNLSALAQYTHSYLPLTAATQIVAPRTDFAERSYYGFLNTYSTQTPEEESRFLRAQRSSLTFGGQYNGSVSDRDRGVRYSKVESVYEVGGAQGKFGYLGQALLQGIKRESDDMVPRLKFVGAAAPPITDLSRRLQLVSRVNGEAFLGRTAYGWLEGTSGLSYRPTNWLRLSGGSYASGDLGTPQFGMDPLYAKVGLIGRSDVVVGGLTFIYIVKQDLNRGAYDHEVSIRQVVGPFELYYALRQFPRNRNLGLTLRIEPFVDALKKRVAEVSGKSGPKR